MQEYVNETGAGRCGRSVRWSIDENYILTVSGKGPMKNYNTGAFDLEGNVPWVNSQFMIVKTIVEEGVTSIGNFAFIDFASMEEIILPSTLVKIGEGAFDRCASLKAISLPEGLKEIGDGAFADSGLQEIILPESVGKIGKGAFSYCRDLKKITICNPACQIGDAGNTVPQETVIVCADASSAHDYAAKYGRKYQPIAG